MPLAAPGSLSGVAFGVDGAPIARLTISTRDDETGTSRTVDVQCPAGRWRLDHVVAGHLQILASDGSGGGAQQRVVLAPGQALDGVQLQLAPPQAAQATAASRAGP